MTKEIGLSQNKIALVDDDDFELLSQYSWNARKRPSGNFYASRYLRLNGKQAYQYMHHLIMGYHQIDHKNHDGLDNRKENLRIATTSQNNANRKKKLGTSSSYIGVTWHKRHGKWYAHITKNYVKHYLGCFEKEEDAAMSYDIAALKEFGEFANLNFSIRIST